MLSVFVIILQVRNWGAERLNNFLKVVQWVSDTTWIWTCLSVLRVSAPNPPSPFSFLALWCIWQFTCHQLWTYIFPHHSSPVVCLCKILWHSVCALVQCLFTWLLNQIVESRSCHIPLLKNSFIEIWLIYHRIHPFKVYRSVVFLYIHRVAQLSSLSYTFVKILVQYFTT